MDVQLKVVQGKPLGHFLHFPTGEFVFGRGPECHVRPNSDCISRQHCLLKVQEHDVFLRDLGSSNGTLVNGQRITEETRLRSGDTLQLGPVVLELSISNGPTLFGHVERRGTDDTLHDGSHGEFRS